MNYKPIAQLMTRFSIPMPLNMSGLSAFYRVELLGNLVRALSLASNFHVQYDALERRIYQSAGKIVIYNFWSITRNITRLIFSLLSH